MVVKTTRCTFTEEKIYPGHGVVFIRRDARKLEFGTKKAHHLYHTNRKPLNLRWCKQWRRAHKKEEALRHVKKEKRTKLKSERGIEGLTIQKLLQKKNESETDRTKNREKKSGRRNQKTKNRNARY